MTKLLDADLPSDVLLTNVWRWTCNCLNMSPIYVDCTQLPTPTSTRRLQTTVIPRTVGTATSSTAYGITVLVRL